jgi:drug/metabolite transporter (DMT)-like permease
MLSVVLAMLAHAGNAVTFVADKALLGSRSRVGRPAQFAALSGAVAAGSGALLFIDFAPPTPFVMMASWWAGVLWVTGLWFFFAGLQKGETSRIVPIAGASVTFFTFVLARFLGERLRDVHLWGVFLLMSGGFLLTWTARAKRWSVEAALLAVGSGAAFAGYFVVVDVVYDRFQPFAAALGYTRLGVGVAGFVLLLALMCVSDTPPRAQHGFRRGVTSLFVGSKIIAVIALILQHYAISLGSVTLVTALQGSQYLFVLLLAATLTRRWPSIFAEELRRTAVWQKMTGIAAVSIGVALLVL